MHLDTEQDRYEERSDRLKKWLGIAGKWFVVAALAIAMTVSMPKTSLAVGKGAHGPDVYVIQGMLKAIGSYSGPITGHYNQATVRGVKYYQKKHGLPVTGTVDKRTFTSLVYAYSSKRIGGGQSWRGKSGGRGYDGQGAGSGGGAGQGGGGAGSGGGAGQGGGGAGIGGGAGQGGGGAGIGGGAGQGGGGAGIGDGGGQGGGTGQGGGQGQGIEEEQEDLGKGKTELKEELKEEKKDEIKEEKKEEIKDEDHGKAKDEDHGKVKEDDGHDHGKAKGDQGYGGGQQPQAPQGDTKDDKGYGYGGRGN